MNHSELKLTSIALAVAFITSPVFAQGAAAAASPASAASAPTADESSATVVITGQRANRVSNGATNLDLDAKETPQAISFVTQEQMRDFGADDINDALRLTTGIRVEQVGTNQTQFLSRGFEIKNTQIDGVGMPNGWGIVTNSMDTFGYDKVR